MKAWCLVAFSFVVACGSKKWLLNRVDPVAAGAECVAGGVKIVSGEDKNDDHLLTDAEVTSQRIVCSDTVATPPPPRSLTATRALAEGSAECPAGGTVLEVGLDDGEGGGIAGDGILQDGEVDKTEFICQALQANVGSTESPTGPVGVATLTARGGASAIGAGAAGGDVTIAADSFTNGGHVKVFRNGSFDATLPAMIAAPASDAGTCVIATSVTLAASGCTVLGGILMVDATHSANGLRVASGATLTVTAVTDLTIKGPIINDGVITLDAGADITLRASAYFGAPATTLSSAQNLTLVLDNLMNRGDMTTAGKVLNLSSDVFHNSGLVSTTGPTNGAALNIASWVFLNSGTIDASGHAGVVANAGDIDIRPLSAPGAAPRFISSGTIRAVGAGDADNGGNAGKISLAAQLGDTIITGLWQATGASGNNTCGIGGDIAIKATAGSLRLSSSIHTDGGSSKAGCAAGAISLTLQSPLSGSELELRGVTSIDTQGGAGAAGLVAGAGGDINIAHQQLFGGAVINEADLTTGGGAVALRTALQGLDLGFEFVRNSGAINTTGGFGRPGGRIVFMAKSRVDNTAALTSRAIAYPIGPGFAGAAVWLTCLSGDLHHQGAIDTSGGDGARGGDAGDITLNGSMVTASGALAAQGGTASNAVDTGGSGGRVWISSRSGTSAWSGTANVNAGSGGVGALKGEVVIDGVQQ